VVRRTERVPFRLALWAMAVLLPACAGRGVGRVHPVDPSGVWEGEVRIAEARLALTVSLEQTSSGWHGLVDVPSQYARQHPLVDVRVDTPAIRFAPASSR
jgi:hypothetical protein